MITRKEFANQYIDQYCNKNNIDRNKVTDWGNYMKASGCLAVCLEYLGLLTVEQEKYSKSRGGILKIMKDANGYPLAYSMRDLLNELPDEKSKLETIDLKGSTLCEFKNALSGNINTYHIRINGLFINRIEIDHIKGIVNIIGE